MKNLNMSTKLLVSFISISLLMVLLGSAAYTLIRTSANETDANLKTRLPAIAKANEVTNQSLAMIAEMRSFAAKGLIEDYNAARKLLDSSREIAGEAAGKSVRSNEEGATFRGFVEMLDSYETKVIETSVALSAVAAKRETMGAVVTKYESDLAEMRMADAVTTGEASIRTAEWWRSFARAQRATRERFRAGEFRNDTGLLLQAVGETEKEMDRLQDTGAVLSEAMRAYPQEMAAIEAAVIRLIEVDRARAKIGDQIIQSCLQIVRQEQTALEVSGDDIAKRLIVVSRFLIAGLVACVVLSIIVSIFLARAISRPLEAAVRYAEAIAAGDYTQRIRDDRKDEIGDLGRALNSVSTALQDSVSSMLEGVNVLSSSVAQIISSTSELAASASETAASVSETSATVEEVKQTGILSNEKSQYVAQTSRASVQSLREGERAAEQLTAGMDHIRAQTESVAAAIDRLAEHSRLIGEIITSVDEIAEQSNILAVNAAIEAAKAGEQGRGFAVVAREIRSLSDQSKRSTSRVRGILAQIESGTAEAVRAVDRGNEAVEQGRNHTRQASQSIQDMREVIQATSEASAQIAVMSQQQVIGMDQATLAMSSIKQASYQTAESMKQLESAAQSLRDLGERLRDLAAR